MADFKWYDYESLKNLAWSEGWKIIKEELQKDIDAIVLVCETPTTDDMFWKISEMDAIKQLNLLNYKKMELTYLRKLLNMPERLIATKIK